MAQGAGKSVAVSLELSSGARAVSIATGVVMLWRALGTPSLGPVVMGLGGAALLWHGLSARSPVTKALPAPERIGGRRRDATKAADPVHRASDDSFPASDPPSWTPTNGPGRRH